MLEIYILRVRVIFPPTSSCHFAASIQHSSRLSGGQIELGSARISWLTDIDESYICLCNAI